MDLLPLTIMDFHNLGSPSFIFVATQPGLGQFHRALSTSFGAWNTNFGAPNIKIGFPNAKIQFSFSFTNFGVLNTKIGTLNINFELLNNPNYLFRLGLI